MLNKIKNEEIYTVDYQKIIIDNFHSNGFIYTIDGNVIIQMIVIISGDVGGK